MSNGLSTVQVAKLLGIGNATLHRWMRGQGMPGKLRAPATRKVGGVSVRLWNATDVDRAKKYKAANYRKGRGRKPKPKR